MNTNIEISPTGSLLVFKHGYSADFVRTTLQDNNLRGLYIFAQLPSEKLESLSFLNEFGFLKSLSISTINDQDWSFLAGLTNLRELSISTTGQNQIDLSKQQKLTSLSLQWRKGKISNLENCHTIKSLCLIDFNEEDFYPIEKLTTLEELTIKTSGVRSLNGLQKLSRLKKLHLGNCKKLSKLTDFQSLTQLASLSFESCPQVESYTELANLPSLKKLEFIDCKNVNTIKFIENLHSLEQLNLLGNTNILDGDLEPALKIPSVLYTHRQHYNVKISNPSNDLLNKKNRQKIRDAFKGADL